jgi:hypothetical protein
MILAPTRRLRTSATITPGTCAYPTRSRLLRRRCSGSRTRSWFGDVQRAVWEILKADGIDPAPPRASTTWAAFLRSPAHALLACDFIETITLTGQRQYVLAVIEHATRRVRVLSATAHPTAGWVAQLARNLVMDLDDAGATVGYLIRDRDATWLVRLSAQLTRPSRSHFAACSPVSSASSLRAAASGPASVGSIPPPGSRAVAASRGRLRQLDAESVRLVGYR